MLRGTQPPPLRRRKAVVSSGAPPPPPPLPLTAIPVVTTPVVLVRATPRAGERRRVPTLLRIGLILLVILAVTAFFAVATGFIHPSGAGGAARMLHCPEDAGGTCAYETTPYCTPATGACAECTRDDHCVGGTCEGGACVQAACSSAADCLGSLACVDGACVVQSGTGSGSRSSAVVSATGGACDARTPCTDGTWCKGGVCTAHSSAAGVYVAARGVPSVAALPWTAGASTSFILDPAGTWPLVLSLHAAGPDRFTLHMHKGAQSRPVLHAGTVYWYAVTTEEERAALSTIPAYTGQELSDATYLAVATRNGDVVHALRFYEGVDRTSFLALTRNYVHSGRSRLAAGAQGFTYVVWVT